MLAQAAAPTVPATPLASLLGGVLPVLAGAVIGYVLGILRDANKAKADREARHQDQVLEAAAELLATTEQVQKAAAHLFFKDAAASRAEKKYPDKSLDLTDQREKTTHEFMVATVALVDATALTKPHRLRISILAPNMEALADAAVQTASHPGVAGGTKAAKDLQAEYTQATQQFTSAIRAYLKVKP